MRQQIKIFFYDFQNWPKMFHSDVFEYLKYPKKAKTDETENIYKKNHPSQTKWLLFSISFVNARDPWSAWLLIPFPFDMLVTI